MKYVDYKKFYNKYKNKAVDSDGVYGAQCVDLFKLYLKEAGDKNYNRALGGDGYAGRIYDRFDSLGYNKTFKKINKNEVKPGDWMIWDKHVGIVINKEKDGLLTVFGQNQNGTSKGTNIYIYLNTNIGAGPLLGVIRQKAKKAKTKGKTQEQYEKAANDVIKGKYGNGKKRKELLEKEGFNYNKIQNIVNKKMGVI